MFLINKNHFQYLFLNKASTRVYSSEGSQKGQVYLKEIKRNFKNSTSKADSQINLFKRKKTILHYLLLRLLNYKAISPFPIASKTELRSLLPLLLRYYPVLPRLPLVRSTCTSTTTCTSTFGASTSASASSGPLEVKDTFGASVKGSAGSARPFTKFIKKNLVLKFEKKEFYTTENFLLNALPYGKSFLCYWLLPFAGFVFSSNLSINFNKQFNQTEFFQAPVTNFLCYAPLSCSSSNSNTSSGPLEKGFNKAKKRLDLFTLEKRINIKEWKKNALEMQRGKDFNTKHLLEWPIIKKSNELLLFSPFTKQAENIFYLMNTKSSNISFENTMQNSNNLYLYALENYIVGAKGAGCVRFLCVRSASTSSVTPLLAPKVLGRNYGASAQESAVRFFLAPKVLEADCTSSATRNYGASAQKADEEGAVRFAEKAVVPFAKRSSGAFGAIPPPVLNVYSDKQKMQFKNFWLNLNIVDLKLHYVKNNSFFYFKNLLIKEKNLQINKFYFKNHPSFTCTFIPTYIPIAPATGKGKEGKKDFTFPAPAPLLPLTPPLFELLEPLRGSRIGLRLRLRYAELPRSGAPSTVAGAPSTSTVGASAQGLKKAPLLRFAEGTTPVSGCGLCTSSALLASAPLAPKVHKKVHKELCALRNTYGASAQGRESAQNTSVNGVRRLVQEVLVLGQSALALNSRSFVALQGQESTRLLSVFPFVKNPCVITKTNPPVLNFFKASFLLDQFTKNQLLHCNNYNFQYTFKTSNKNTNLHTNFISVNGSKRVLGEKSSFEERTATLLKVNRETLLPKPYANSLNLGSGINNICNANIISTGSAKLKFSKQQLYKLLLNNLTESFNELTINNLKSSNNLKTLLTLPNNIKMHHTVLITSHSFFDLNNLLQNQPDNVNQIRSENIELRKNAVNCWGVVASSASSTSSALLALPRSCAKVFLPSTEGARSGVAEGVLSPFGALATKGPKNRASASSTSTCTSTEGASASASGAQQRKKRLEGVVPSAKRSSGATPTVQVHKERWVAASPCALSVQATPLLAPSVLGRNTLAQRSERRKTTSIWNRVKTIAASNGVAGLKPNQHFYYSTFIKTYKNKLAKLTKLNLGSLLRNQKQSVQNLLLINQLKSYRPLLVASSSSACTPLQHKEGGKRIAGVSSGSARHSRLPSFNSLSVTKEVEDVKHLSFQRNKGSNSSAVTRVSCRNNQFDLLRGETKYASNKLPNSKLEKIIRAYFSIKNKLQQKHQSNNLNKKIYNLNFKRKFDFYKIFKNELSFKLKEAQDTEIGVLANLSNLERGYSDQKKHAYNRVTFATARSLIKNRSFILNSSFILNNETSLKNKINLIKSTYNFPLFNKRNNFSSFDGAKTTAYLQKEKFITNVLLRSATLCALRNPLTDDLGRNIFTVPLLLPDATTSTTLAPSATRTIFGVTHTPLGSGAQRSGRCSVEQQRKTIQKKRRRKKLKKETRRRKKRKRFYPRPTWLRYTVFLKFINKRNTLRLAPSVLTRARASNRTPASSTSTCTSTCTSTEGASASASASASGAQQRKKRLEGVVPRSGARARGLLGPLLRLRLPLLRFAEGTPQHGLRDYPPACAKGARGQEGVSGMQAHEVALLLARVVRAKSGSASAMQALARVTRASQTIKTNTLMPFSFTKENFTISHSLNTIKGGFGSSYENNETNFDSNLGGSEAGGSKPRLSLRTEECVTGSGANVYNKVLLKSYWLRTNLNPYLKRVKTILTKMKERLQKWQLINDLKQFLNIIGGFTKTCQTPSLAPPYRLSAALYAELPLTPGHLRCCAYPFGVWRTATTPLLARAPFGGFAHGVRKGGEGVSKAIPPLKEGGRSPLNFSNVWENTLYYAEHNRVTYLRIEEFISQIRENFATLINYSTNFSSSNNNTKDTSKYASNNELELRARRNKKLKARSCHINHSKIQHSKREEIMTKRRTTDFWVKLGKTINTDHNSGLKFTDYTKKDTYFNTNPNNNQYINIIQSTIPTMVKQNASLLGFSFAKQKPTLAGLRTIWAVSKTAPYLTLESAADSLSAIDNVNKPKVSLNSTLYKRKQIWVASPESVKFREQTKYNKTKKMLRQLSIKIQTLLNEQTELIKKDSFFILKPDYLNSHFDFSSRCALDPSLKLTSNYEQGEAELIFKLFNKTRQKEEKYKFINNHSLKNLFLSKQQIRQFKKSLQINTSSTSLKSVNFPKQKNYEINNKINFQTNSMWLTNLTNKSSYWWLVSSQKTKSSFSQQSQRDNRNKHQFLWFLKQTTPLSNPYEETSAPSRAKSAALLSFETVNPLYKEQDVKTTTRDVKIGPVVTEQKQKLFFTIFISTLIFHFCTVVTLLSVSQIRSVLKFYLLAISKIYKTLLKIFNAVYIFYKMFTSSLFGLENDARVFLPSTEGARSGVAEGFLSHAPKAQGGALATKDRAASRLEGVVPNPARQGLKRADKPIVLFFVAQLRKEIVKRSSTCTLLPASRRRRSASFVPSIAPSVARAVPSAQRTSGKEGLKKPCAPSCAPSSAERTQAERTQSTTPLLALGGGAFALPPTLFGGFARAPKVQGVRNIQQAKRTPRTAFGEKRTQPALLSAGQKIGQGTESRIIKSGSYNTLIKSKKLLLLSIFEFVNSLKIIYGKKNQLFNNTAPSLRSFLTPFGIGAKEVQLKVSGQGFNQRMLKNLVLLNKIFSYFYILNLTTQKLLKQSFDVLGRFGPKSIFNFLEKPGELIIDWIAYLFLVEWSSDIANTIPENADIFVATSYYKFTRVLHPLVNFLPQFSLTLAINQNAASFLAPLSLPERLSIGVGFNSLNSSVSSFGSAYLEPNKMLVQNTFINANFAILSSTFIQNRIYHLYEILLFQFYQPDTDLIIRQKKGTIFWNIWGDFLTQVAEDLNVNISELTSLKEEQIKLLEKSSDASYALLPLLPPGTRASASASASVSSGRLLDVVRPRNGSRCKPSAPTATLAPSSASRTHKERTHKPKAQQTPSGLVKPVLFAKFLTYKTSALINGSLAYESRENILTKNFKQNIFYKNYKLQEGEHNFSINKVKHIFTRKNFAAQQFLSYEGKDTELFIDLHPPKSFNSVSLLQKNESVQTSIGSLVCQIFAGTMSKQISKNILMIIPAKQEQTMFSMSCARRTQTIPVLNNLTNQGKTLLIQAIAGETELKIITDSAYRYAMVYRGVAVGIKLLRDVFDSLCLHTPCLFLIEDIHAIAERRPLLISDDEKGGSTSPSGKSIFGSQREEIHEKNQILYQLSKHVISHYKKPYKGDFSLLIPTNHFSFDLFSPFNTASARSSTSTGQGSNSFSFPASKIFIKTIDNNQNSNQTQDSTYVRGNSDSQMQLNNIKKSILSIKNRQFFAPPATSPFSLLTLKEDKKFKPYKNVSEMPWSGLPGEQLAQLSKSSYSIRVKVAILADMAISTLSVKLDMITDLLVIIDSVKGNRGFVVFATTHVPSILDPALRRPGRFDETITLSAFPNLIARWHVLKASSGGSVFVYAKKQTKNLLCFDLTTFAGSSTSAELCARPRRGRRNTFGVAQSAELLAPKVLRQRRLPLLALALPRSCAPDPEGVVPRSGATPSVLVQVERSKGRSQGSASGTQQKKNVFRYAEVQVQEKRTTPYEVSHMHSPALVQNVYVKEVQSEFQNLLIHFKLKQKNSGHLKSYLYNVANEFTTFSQSFNKTKVNHQHFNFGNNSIYSIKQTYNHYKKQIKILSGTYIIASSMCYQININKNFNNFVTLPTTNNNTNSSRTNNIIENNFNFLDCFIASYPVSQAERSTFVTKNMEVYSLYIILYANPAQFKNYINKLISSKIAELVLLTKPTNPFYLQNKQKSNTGLATGGATLVNCTGKNTNGNKEQSQNMQLSRLHFVWQAQNASFLKTNINQFTSLDTSWKMLSSLVLSLIQKRYLYNTQKANNLIVSKFLSFNNNSSLYEASSPPSSNILLPARRYENYRRSFSFFSNKKISISITEKIQYHQQQRLVKRLYGFPVQEQFRSEVNSSLFKESQITNFTNATLMIGNLTSELHKPSNSNWFIKNRILRRHKNYLINQWYNAQLPEHNAETTFLSDIDWRYCFIESIGDLLLDFPDAQQHYNPRNRRWFLTKGYYHNWFNFEKNFSMQVYTHFMFDSFTTSFKFYEQNRETLDFYAYYISKSSLINQSLIKPDSLFRLFKDATSTNFSTNYTPNEIEILTLYKRFFSNF